MKKISHRIGKWLFSLQGKFIVTASFCIVIFTLVGSLAILSKGASLQRQDIINQGKVIAEISRLMLTNVMIYNELGMMDDHDLNDFLDYFIIDFMQRDSRIRYVAVTNTQGRIIACNDITRYGDICYDPGTLVALSDLDTIISPGRYYDEGVINISVPLNISTKSWGALRIVLSTTGVDEAIATLRRHRGRGRPGRRYLPPPRGGDQ